MGLLAGGHPTLIYEARPMFGEMHNWQARDPNQDNETAHTWRTHRVRGSANLTLDFSPVRSVCRYFVLPSAGIDIGRSTMSGACEPFVVADLSGLLRFLFKCEMVVAYPDVIGAASKRPTSLL